MTRRTLRALCAAAFLGGCASYQDRASPCACDWRPINEAPETLA